MAHLRSTSYYQDSHDDYASTSSSHRQPHHSLHLPKTERERRGRPAYTTVRPFIINSADEHHRPLRRERDDHDEHHRRVGDYVADHLVPTMLRSSDRPVEVFMNFGDANLALPNLDHWSEHGHGRRVPSKGPNAIIYNAPGCSLTIGGQRCDRYCDRCEMVGRGHRDRPYHQHHHRELHHEIDDRHHHLPRDNNNNDRSRSHVRIISHSRNPSPSPLPLHVLNQHHRRHQELDLDHVGRRHRDRHPRSRSQHVRVTSYSGSRNPSPSPGLPLPGLFPIATAVENARHNTNRNHRVSHALCPGCLIKTTVYKDGYCADCGPPTYPSSSRRVDATPSPVPRERGHGTRVRYTRDQVIGGGSSSEDGWARVEVASRDSGRYRARSRGRDRGSVYDVITDGGGYGGSRKGKSKWEKERRSMPRYSGYASESDL